AVVARRIDVIGLSAGSGLRLEARANRNDAFRLAIDAVRIRHHKAALVIGRGFKIEDASRESIRRDVLQRVLVIRSLPMRSRGSPSFQACSPFFRYDTATAALRLSSPSM